MSFYIPGSKSICNLSNGNVGINTINPQYSLDITGNLNLTGQLFNNGSSFTPATANSVTSGQSTQILFNQSGSSTGSYGLTFNSNTSTLTIGSSGSIFYNSTGMNFDSNLIPTSDQLTLGASGAAWKDLYVSTGSIYLGNAVFSNQNNSIVVSQPISTNYLDSSFTSNFTPVIGGSIDIASTQYLSAPYNTNYNLSASTDFTIQFWIYLVSHDTNGGLLSFYDASTSSGWDIFFYSVSEGIIFRSSGGLIYSGGTIPLNEWCHIAIVRNAGTITFYINGNSDTTSSSSDAFQPTNPVSLNIFTNNSISSFTVGKLTNLSINNTTAIYTDSFVPPTQSLQPISGTVLLLDVLNSSSYLTDSSVIAATITEYNGATWSVDTPLSLGVTVNAGSDGLPYPYVINVNTSSYISNTTFELYSITFNNFSYSNMNWSCHILIEAPNNQTCWLINNPDSYEAVNNAQITFVDSINFPLIVGPMTTGTYRPTSTNNSFELPAPAPLCNNTSFIPLRSTSPDGEWKLWVYDDDLDGVYNGGSIGSISLNFNTYYSSNFNVLEVSEALVQNLNVSTGTMTNLSIDQSIIANNLETTTSTINSLTCTNATVTSCTSQNVSSNKLNVIQSIIESSNGYVIAGQGGGSLGRSSNGNAWDSYSLFSTGGYGVAWNGSNTLPLYIGVGDGDETLAYSYNASEWTGAGRTVFNRGRAIAYNPYPNPGNPYWVAVGEGIQENINYSYDGLVWYPAQYDYTFPIFTDGIGLSVMYINDKWWVGTNDSVNTLISSDDGIYWYGEGNSIFPTSCNCFAYNGYNIALAGGSNVGTSVLASFDKTINGWTDITVSSGILDIIDTSINGACWNSKQFFIVGQSTLPTKGAYSENGIQWTGNTLGGLVNGNATCISYKNSATSYLAGGSGTSTIIYSNDNGTTWNSAITPAFTTVTNAIVAVDNNSFSSGYSTFTNVYSDGLLSSNISSATILTSSLTCFDQINIGSSGSIFYNSTGMNFNSNLIPSTSGLSIGTLDYPWESIYISTGTVFIGPTGALQINSNGLISSLGGFAAPYFQVGATNPGAGILLTQQNNLLYFQNELGVVGPVSVFNSSIPDPNNTYYSLTGNVGFGVTGPNQKIDVLGNIRASDTVIAQNFTGTNLHISSIEANDSTLNIATVSSKTNTVNIGTSDTIQTVNIGTVGSGNTTINLGGVGDTVNVAGTLVYVNSTVTEISNPQFIINQSGTNINNTGLTVYQNGGPTGAYILVNSSSDAWTLKAGAGSLVTLNQDVSNGASVNFGTATLSGLTLNQDTISLGTNVNAQNNSVGIGYQSLQSSTGPYAVAIGYQAAQTSNVQGYSIALGYKAGQTSQSESSIAIGYEGGLINQGKWGLSVGYQSGRTNQGQYAIALGFQSAYESQSTNSIAIGNGAGRTTQAASSIAIGNGAGYTNQGSNCIAIGQNAGNTNQANGSIILNGTSNNFNTTTSGFFVNPVRNVTNSQLVQYNTSTNELTYSNNATLNNLTASTFTGTTMYTTNLIASNTVSATTFTGTNVTANNIVSNNVTTNKVQFGGLGSIYFQTGSATGCFIDGVRNATGSSNLIYNSTTKEITYTTPNYLYAYYTGTQQTSSTSYTGVLFNQVPILDGFTHTSNSALFSFTADTNGIYQITYSLEVHNDNNAVETLTAYLDIDGTPISGSARSVALTADTNETTLSNIVLSNILSGTHTIQVLMRSTNETRITIQNPIDVPAPGLAGSAASLTIHRII